MIKTSWKQVMAAVLALTVTHIFVPSQDIEAKIVKNKNKKSSVKKRSKSRKIKSKKGKNVKKTKNKGSKKRGSKRSLGGGSTGSGSTGSGGGGGSTGSGGGSPSSGGGGVSTGSGSPSSGGGSPSSGGGALVNAVNTHAETPQSATQNIKKDLKALITLLLSKKQILSQNKTCELWNSFLNMEHSQWSLADINGEGLCWLRAILVALDAQETHKEPTSLPEQQQPKSPYYTDQTGPTFIQKVEKSGNLDAVLTQLIKIQTINKVQSAWEQWHRIYQGRASSGPSTTLAEKLGSISMQQFLGVNDTYDDYIRVLEKVKDDDLSSLTADDKQLLIRALLTVPFHPPATLPINMQQYDETTGKITSKDKPAALEDPGIIPLFNQLFDRNIIVIDATQGFMVFGDYTGQQTSNTVSNLQIQLSSAPEKLMNFVQQYILTDNIDRKKTIVLLKYNRQLESANSGDHYDLLWYKK